MCGMDACVHRSTLACIFEKFQDPDIGGLGDSADGGVSGFIIHEYDFKLTPRQCGADLFTERGYVVFFVIKRNYD
jgi:hypothetical protein